MKKKCILVTGGAGFIGSHVNKLLHRAGYDTVVLDNLSLGNAKNVLYGSFVQGDIGHVDDLNAIFSTNEIAAVMHFAAFTDVGESVKDPARYYQNNVANTLVLLNSMRQHAVKTFLFSSSAAIFGPNDKPIKETDTCNPINPYGHSKLIVEQILHDYAAAYGIRYACLRYFNAAGGDPDREIKNYKQKENNLIPLLLKSLKDPQACLKIFGTDYATADGTCIRDYIHIYDLSTAHILALESLLQGGASTCFNLGNGRGFSVREVITAAERVTGLKVNAIEAPRRAGDPPALLADAAKAKKELGWKTRYPDLDTIIAHAWQALP